MIMTEPITLARDKRACQCETDEKRHVSADREKHENRLFCA